MEHVFGKINLKIKKFFFSSSKILFFVTKKTTSLKKLNHLSFFCSLLKKQWKCFMMTPILNYIKHYLSGNYWINGGLDIRIKAANSLQRNRCFATKSRMSHPILSLIWLEFYKQQNMISNYQLILLICGYRDLTKWFTQLIVNL